MEKSPKQNMKPSSDNKDLQRLREALAKAKKEKGSGFDYGKAAVEALNRATKDKAQLRKTLEEHLERALAIADELQESAIGYAIETALDHLRAGNADRLMGKGSRR